MTNLEMMEIFKDRYELEVDDIRPLSIMHLNGEGIVIYLKNGDKMAYFPDMRGDTDGDFISEEYPDLVGIVCMVGKGGIWFWDSSLENAQFI